MSDFKFRLTWEMSHDELLAYVADLENRIMNAVSGAVVFKEEAMVQKALVEELRGEMTELEHTCDEIILMFARHLEAVVAMMNAGEKAVHTTDEYGVVFRQALIMISGILFNVQDKLIIVDDNLKNPPDWSDIPF